MTRPHYNDRADIPDYFAWTAEHPGLHGSSVEFIETERVLIERCCRLPEAQASRIKLGIIYAKRVHSEDPSVDLLADLKYIESATQDYDNRILARAIHAIVRLLRCRQYTESLDSLEQIQEELRANGHDLVYGIVRRGIASALMFLGRHSAAEVAFQDSLATFRRFELTLLLASAHCDYAIVKKKLGRYDDARVLLREAVRLYDAAGVVRGKVQALANLGIVESRTGDWAAAEKFYRRAARLVARYQLDQSSQLDTHLINACKAKLEHLDLLRRRYSDLGDKFGHLIAAETDPRAKAILYEYLGELDTEIGLFAQACENLQKGYDTIATVLPKSDVMTEILRRQAQLDLVCGSVERARERALACIRLSLEIGDRYELGAATRVLGEVYVSRNDMPRAKACFGSAVSVLKRIHECYELMRSLYAQGKFLANHGKRDDAEISLLEARQLAKKLELDYYQALIAIALVDALIPQERWHEATSWLQEGTTLRDGLEGTDRERVEREVQRVANELQIAITRSSVREAETLKTICRVYEDARFPIVEMRADLAYQVAQSAGGMSLFIAARKGGGYYVPLTYNIAVNDAKELVRRFDESRKDTFLKLNGEARVLALPNNCTLVAIPCQTSSPRNGKDKSNEIYALCTCFDKDATVGPRQIEILCASADALVRLVDDEEERHAKPSEEEISRARHPRGSFKDILTIDPGMIKVIKLAEKAASSVAPLLLQGETGVGKELFARAIHESSKRKDGPFVAVNAGGMPVGLLESELFGHVKGAFTDAGSDRQGFVDTARGGTLFLDEIGEMGEELQVKLLRLLENGEYRRLGESSMRKADVRVVSATNKELSKEVERGRFRRDLYYRVSPLRLTIPPLRLRAVDIQLMVRHFLRDCARMNGIGDRMIEIDVKAMEALELYDWPGNVRELHNEILRVVSLIGRGDLVRFSMLSEHIQQYLQAKRRGADGLLERSVEQYERRLILHALENNDWNHLRTAESIGVPRTTLLAKLKRLNIPAKL